MRILPCGDESLLVELAGPDQVLGLSEALRRAPPDGVLEVVPAARTVLLSCAPGSLASVADAVRATTPVPPSARAAAEVEVPVVYDGEDLEAVATALGWAPDGLVARHTAAPWTVAFCGFAPGFAYLVRDDWPVVARRGEPRTRVPCGAVGLAGPYSGVYPRESPGGWQLVGRTDLAVLDLARQPPALLTPGTAVRFVDAR